MLHLLAVQRLADRHAGGLGHVDEQQPVAAEQLQPSAPPGAEGRPQAQVAEPFGEVAVQLHAQQTLERLARPGGA
ncbi:hypothetical protein [Phenylobacterium sp.]|uniref:hypothetical protein n=1 Tax=Phenylobacterium sp. TaxID=1871053 RepID=UPI0025F70638|nr:hypothetical protein [Phenylobacterium sp.]